VDFVNTGLPWCGPNFVSVVKTYFRVPDTFRKTKTTFTEAETNFVVNKPHFGTQRHTLRTPDPFSENLPIFEEK
jgi:hypothetical protein